MLMILPIVFSAVITAQPLANPEVLPESVFNEVERALDVAATNAVSVTEESVAFAGFCATNGATATERAVRLVSSQKDGRWFWRGVDVTPVATRALRRLAGLPEPPLRLSIFANHISDAARQEKISFEEAARRVKALGVAGVDVMAGIAPEKLAVLRRLGFEISCVIGFTRFERGYDRRQCEELMALAETNGCPTVMLVPGAYPSADEPADVRRAIVARTRRFVAEAARRGLVTVIEDFDDKASPTCGYRRLADFLASDSRLGFVYDTGNFYEAGGRPEDGLRLLPRVRHFHLKDRAAAAAGSPSVAVGSGCVPMAKIISAARDVGYGGWFTIEHFCVTNMLECMQSSARHLTVHPF